MSAEPAAEMEVTVRCRPRPKTLRVMRLVVALLLLVGTLKVRTYESDAGQGPTAAAPGLLPSPGSLSTDPATTTTVTTSALEPVTVPPASTSTEPPSPTTAAPVPTAVRPAAKRAVVTSAPAPSTAPTSPPPTSRPVVPPVLDAPQAAPAAADGVAPYRGLGTWVDVYDWSNTYTSGRPTTSPGDVDRMHDAGVQTLYIQASKHDAPSDVLEPELLQAYIDRARNRGMKVVAWYLPTLVDVGRDLQRLRAVAALRGIDGIGVDIEARNVGDVNERNRRLVELSSELRRALPGRTIAAIVLPPVVLEVINPGFWPNFPYREIAPSYDVWMTMGYWTNRKGDSGYRDAYRYTRENVDRLRAQLNQPQAPVHPIGGIGNNTTGGDVDAYKRAVADTSGLGGSLYDWRTTAAGLWPALRGLRIG